MHHHTIEWPSTVCVKTHDWDLYNTQKTTLNTFKFASTQSNALFLFLKKKHHPLPLPWQCWNKTIMSSSENKVEAIKWQFTLTNHKLRRNKCDLKVIETKIVYKTPRLSRCFFPQMKTKSSKQNDIYTNQVLWEVSYKYIHLRKCHTLV